MLAESAVPHDGLARRFRGSRTDRLRQPLPTAGSGGYNLIHDLRHTHATILLEAGVPIHVVQHRLGHETVATTIDLYGHLTPAADRLAADTLARALSTAGRTKDNVGRW